MHVDLDYFYAQCEELVRPNIKGKPLVVCVYSGRTEESGVVSTCNYEARKYGVRAGISIVRAKKLLETTEATFLPVNRALYELVSERIMELLKTYGDSFEKVGIDEAYLDVSASTNASFKHAEEVASRIKQGLLYQEQMTCSVGIAPNKLLAKIASDQTKPNGLTVVRPEEVKAFLAPLSVGRIPGVGKKIEEKLIQLKVRTIADLSTLNATILIETFGMNLGNYLYLAARGEDDKPVKEREQPTQFSRIATLKRNTHEITEILPLLYDLATSVTLKLTEKNMTCRSVGVIAILEDLSIHNKSKILEFPTSEECVIRQLSKELMEEFLHAMPSAVVRRVGVKLSILAMATGQADISQYLDE